MKIIRATQAFGALYFAAIAAVGIVPHVSAQPYPSKPIRVVIPFPAGGTTDILARAIGQKLTEEWKQQVIIDNRPGGGANIGAEIAVKSPPDGYTLLMASTAHSINASLYTGLTYDPIKDFTPVTLIAVTGQVLCVHPSVPVKSIKEFIGYAKKRPGELNYSSAGNGSLPHLAAELFRSRTGINIVHVPYKGAPPAMTDLLAGHVALSFATAPSAVPHVKSGKLRALGVSTATRMPALPEVPTIAENAVADFEASNFFGLAGPPGMPLIVVDRLNAAVVRIVQSPGIAKYMSEQGADALTSTPAEYGAHLKSEVVKWAKVVKDSGAKID